MIFNVFRRDAQSREQGFMGQSNRKTKKGFNPYKKKAGAFGSKSYLVDESSEKFNRLEEGFHGYSAMQMDATDAFLTKKQGEWQASGMRDAREGYAKAQMERAISKRQDASDDLAGMQAQARPSSTAEAQASFNNRVQGFRRARNKLKEARDSVSNVGGPQITYNETGYEALNPELDKFYADFDQQVSERRAEYVSQYGGSSYDDLMNEGYSSGAGARYGEDFLKRQQEITAQLMEEAGASAGGGGFQGFQSGGGFFEQLKFRGQAAQMAMEEFGMTQEDMAVGKQDIDALVLGDMLDMEMYDLAFMDTSPEVDGQKFSIDDTMADLRSGLGKLYMSAAGGADDMAKLEDESRAEVARIAQQEGQKTAALTRQRSEESIANQMSDIQSSQRSAEKIRDKQMASLTDAGSTRSKRVRGVDFTEERPQ